MPTTWKPDGYTSVSPYVITEKAGEVVRFLEAALGAVVLRRLDREDGSIMHAELRVDDSVVMLASPAEGWPAVPTYVHVYVPDVDAAYAAALGSGAVSVQPPSQRDDPDRRGGVKDPGGNTWWLGTQVGRKERSS